MSLTTIEFKELFNDYFNKEVLNSWPVKFLKSAR